MSPRKAKVKLQLTERAVRDIASVEAYSVAEWGKRVASKYIADIEAGLERLRENPGLLQAESDLHPELRFYRVNKHLLVCDVQPGAIVVLTLIHASRDIPSRLAELEPTLADEVELLRKRLERGKRRGR